MRGKSFNFIIIIIVILNIPENETPLPLKKIIHSCGSVLPALVGCVPRNDAVKNFRGLSRMLTCIIIMTRII